VKTVEMIIGSLVGHPIEVFELSEMLDIPS